MPPATSSPVLRRSRDEVARPDNPSRRFERCPQAMVRGLPRRARGDRAPRRAAQRRGPGRAVDARREPDQVASRAYDLVLRAVPAAAACSPATASSTSASRYLFNSYYVAAGPRHARPKRGLITRPDCAEVAAYRAHVDDAVERLHRRALTMRRSPRLLRILEIGLHHEQQHQELLLTDILHAFAQNPIAPGLRCRMAARRRRDPRLQAALSICRAASTPSAISGDGYCFDNERPAHHVYLQPARIARALVSNAQWLEFMADGGYATPSLWLSDGWAAVEAEGWVAPGYWRKHDGAWLALTLGGLAAGRSGRAGHPCELLRGRRVRALGRQASADRGGVGSRRAPVDRSTAHRRCLRRGLAVDAQRLFSLSGLSRGRRARSANTTASSWSIRWCCAAARMRRRRAMRARAIAISSIRRRAGSSAACGLWTMSEDARVG